MDEFSSAAAMATEATSIGDTTRTLIIIVCVALFGFVGRLVFVAFSDRVAGINPLRNASGGVMIMAAVALMGGGIFMMNGHVKSLILVRQHVVDPFIVSVLGWDSCDVASGAYCVVVFEDDREIVVNWHDKRVHMMVLLTPPQNPPWGSLRPMTRSDDRVVAQASESVETVPAQD